MDLLNQDIQLTTIHTCADWTVLEEEPVLRVAKTEKQDEFDIDTFVKVGDVSFHNGIIEVDMKSRLLPDAPDFARGFIGIVFRVSESLAEFESYYVRPTNGRHPDPVRRSHGSQYFSYPGYTFAYFREHTIEGFEAPCDIDLNEWIHLKAVVMDEKAEFYVNDMDKPVLLVEALKHGKDARGAVGLYVDTGTDAFFKNLKVECLD